MIIMVFLCYIVFPVYPNLADQHDKILDVIFLLQGFKFALMGYRARGGCEDISWAIYFIFLTIIFK